jgi:pimeloyl-ACP methyl ester carboxylesterase
MTVVDLSRRPGTSVVRANGVDIAYRDAGDGPPLVLLSGGLVSTGPVWAGSHAAHVDHLDDLATRFRVIAPDTRGSGATVHPGGPATFDVLAQDVIALIDALGLGRTLIAGFSEGGATATLVTMQRPDLVAALVNHAGFDYFDAEGYRQQLEHLFRPLFGGRPGATAADPDAFAAAAAGIPGLGDVAARMRADCDGAQGEGHWRASLQQFFERSTTGVQRGLDDVAAITAPTLILTGDRDMLCSPEAACAAYRALPAGALGVLPGVGHEITAAVISTMSRFLGEHAPAA